MLLLLVYANGLNGPFLFDDHIHITQNRWVKIESLSFDNLVQAWGSSFSAFPGDRPLAQLSFGINHAIAGLDPWAFKATNLALHLITGLMVFVFSRLAFRAIYGESRDRSQELGVALFACALWLLSPLHVSTVLYTVQRMAQLSTLATLLALSSYMWGRLQIARGSPGLGWMLATVPIAAIGFFGKENTVLIPLFLLVCEFTLLRQVSLGSRPSAVRLIQAVFIAVPIIAGLAYFFTHPALVYYDERPFTLAQRVLTEPRVLWFYLRLLLIPDIGLFGLFHDDFPLSSDLFSPATTALAIGAWLIALVAALVLRRRSPAFAFAVLFFLAAHALESSVLALEIVFEHRNYLASIGPVFLLAHLIRVTAVRQGVARFAAPLGLLLVAGYTTATYVRVENWSSYESFMLNAAENHPDSTRSNFMAAQVVIAAIGNARGDVSELGNAAEIFLDRGLANDPQCVNCLFGKVVLALHLNRQPEAETVERLKNGLRRGFVGATKVSISQFSYLVKWYRSDGLRLADDGLNQIFKAALANPRWGYTGRAGIEAAYREYFEFVTGDLDAALEHARKAVQIWPTQWSYHMQLVNVLRKLGRSDDALAALDTAAQHAKYASQRTRMMEKRQVIEDGADR